MVSKIITFFFIFIHLFIFFFSYASALYENSYKYFYVIYVNFYVISYEYFYVIFYTSFNYNIYIFLIYYLVSKKPELNPFKFSGTLSAGKRVAVNCAVIDGEPPFVFEWYRDGIPVKSGPSIVIKSIDDFNTNIAITNLGPEHNGNYTCRVSNVHGKDEQWDTLFMKGSMHALHIHKDSKELLNVISLCTQYYLCAYVFSTIIHTFCSYK